MQPLRKTRIELDQYLCDFAGVSHLAMTTGDTAEAN